MAPSFSSSSSFFSSSSSSSSASSQQSFKITRSLEVVDDAALLLRKKRPSRAEELEAVQHEQNQLNSGSLLSVERSDRPRSLIFMPTSDDPLEDELFHKLFRIYSYFAEKNEGLLLKEKEAHFILDELLRVADRPNTSSSIACSTSETVGFRELLGLIDVIFPERTVLEPLVERIFERLVSQVVRKGFLLTRRQPSLRLGCIPMPVPTGSAAEWVPTWATLSPGIIHVQPLHKKLEHRRTLVLERDARVMLEPVAPSPEGSSSSPPLYTWTVHSGNDEYRFSHFDSIQRDSFVRDMELIIERPSRSSMAEYDLRRAAYNDGRAEREHAMRVALEAENKRLGQVLDEERRALKDEEIVRGLATRMLEEEKEKNEQMERLLEELQGRLARRQQQQHHQYHHHHADELQHGYLDEHQDQYGIEDDDDSLPAPPQLREHRRDGEHLLQRTAQRERRRSGREADDEMDPADEDIWREGGEMMQISTTSI